MDIKTILKPAQIIVAIILIVSILLQNRGEGLGSFLGGGGEIFRARRGLERSLYFITIALSVLLIILSIINTILL